ncbi:SUN domain-containing protein 1-like [Rutidosis leptorrhynchoides]|uniref:SUN domain-containing protein 1-like n=1 Tax=Rutidosis leptorrhynchoides TaxID=125765 RepID=UPI003A9A1BA6
MSSSTVSVTANPTGASLRRPTEKKTGSDGIDAFPASGGDTTRANDPDRSIKPGTETTAVERSKDTAQKISNQLPTNSTTTKLRKRNVAKKVTSKPAWKTAVSVIVKNFGILVILLLLAQMIRRLAFNQGSGLDLVLNPGLASMDYERRIAEVEKFLKTTTKMMQVQVEVVDQKIEKEIAGLKSELSKRIDNDRIEFSSKVSEIDKRVEGVERFMSGNEWLSRDEFDKFVEEFLVKKKGGDGEMKLDEIRAFAKEIVEKEIGKHAADGLGRVDYAVATGGAFVLKHSEAFVGSSRISSWVTGNVRSDAVKMLQPSFGQPGECFPLKGDNGFVEIKLRTSIVPEAITLEHVSKSVAFDRSSAPKDCKVLGWLHNEEDKHHLLTEFTYDLEKSIAQTYNVLDTEASNPTVIDTIRLEFMSNHGSPTHTCIYRVRVHGHDANVQ